MSFAAKSGLPGQHPISQAGRFEEEAQVKLSRALTGFIASGALLLSGCFGAQTATLASATTASGSSTVGSNTTTTAIPSGEKAVKIIFKQAYPSGSFDSPSSSGTVNAPGSGAQAMRVFKPDGSLLASGGPTNTAWPKWLSSVEIGISGASNSAAQDADCARFAAAGEDAQQCDFDDSGVVDGKCGAPTGYYRVSEYDCVKSTVATDGTGGPSDGVYVRATFSRNTEYLGASENILAVLEYTASSLSAPAVDPTACFTGGVFTAGNANCSDLFWQIYLKRSVYEVVQPYMMLAPPATAFVNAAAQKGGGLPASKQFVIPLAGDSSLSTIQISRIKGRSAGGDYEDVCYPGGTDAANSPNCVGVVLYSLTFFRI